MGEDMQRDTIIEMLAELGITKVTVAQDSYMIEELPEGVTWKQVTDKLREYAPDGLLEIPRKEAPIG